MTHSHDHETTSIEITRTVRLKLETSQTKTELVRAGINAYQSVLAYMADRLITYPESEWEPRHPHMYHQAKRGLPDDDYNYKTTVALEAQQQVAVGFKSWRERGKPGDRPSGGFGSGSYLALRTDDLLVEENNRGWGLRARFIKYNAVWFHIDAGEFQRKFLRRITDPDDSAEAGGGELRLADDGTLYCHLTVSWPVETWAVDDVPRTIGVDLNDDPLVAAAVWDGDGVLDIVIESGAEFRHHRERMKQAKEQAMENDNLKAVVDSRRDYHRYTEHITNTAARRAVDFARTHEPCCIVLEELTGLRETVDEPIHDWPYAQIQTQITSKAHEEGIPVRRVDPRDTSRECRKCGTTADRSRDGREFECINCGYEVHADVNAAINIAQRGFPEG